MQSNEDVGIMWFSPLDRSQRWTAQHCMSWRHADSGNMDSSDVMSELVNIIALITAFYVPLPTSSTLPPNDIAPPIAVAHALAPITNQQFIWLHAITDHSSPDADPNHAQTLTWMRQLTQGHFEQLQRNTDDTGYSILYGCFWTAFQYATQQIEAGKISRDKFDSAAHDYVLTLLQDTSLPSTRKKLTSSSRLKGDGLTQQQRIDYVKQLLFNRYQLRGVTNSIPPPPSTPTPTDPPQLVWLLHEDQHVDLFVDVGTNELALLRCLGDGYCLLRASWKARQPLPQGITPSTATTSPQEDAEVRRLGIELNQWFKNTGNIRWWTQRATSACGQTGCL